MKTFILTFVLSFLVFTNSAIAQDASVAAITEKMNTPLFAIESSTFDDNGNLPIKTAFDKYGCGGQNILPHFLWSNPPVGTKSFVITAYDPDAPTTTGFWHWGIYNIPATTTELAEGSNRLGYPQGALEIFTDYGEVGYGGACPPIGDNPHHYIFTIYALSVEKLELKPETTTGAALMFNIRDHILAKAKITGLYSR